MRWERAVQQCTALSFSLSNPTQGVPPLEIPGAGPCNNVIKPRKSERRILRLGRQELNKGESKPAFRTQGEQNNARSLPLLLLSLIPHGRCLVLWLLNLRFGFPLRGLEVEACRLGVHYRLWLL